MSFGIALAGGGARGAAHVGVLLALEEAEMRPTAVAGTSAGSIVAGLYAAGVTAYRLREIVLELSRAGILLLDPDYAGILKAVVQLFTRRPVTLSGLLKGKRLERYLSLQTGVRSMQSLPVRTVIPAVDLVSGLTVAYTNSLDGVRPVRRVRWESDIGLCTAIRASCAVPAIFQPLTTDRMCLVDGGVTDVLPVNLLIAAGERSVLAVDISEDYKMPEHTNFMEISAHSLEVMSSCLRQYISSGERFALRPALPDGAGLLSFDRMEECMDAGYRAAKEHIPVLREIFCG